VGEDHTLTRMQKVIRYLFKTEYKNNWILLTKFSFVMIPVTFIVSYYIKSFPLFVICVIIYSLFNHILNEIVEHNNNDDDDDEDGGIPVLNN
jgi:uncharacterized protein involved in cysteine biosynthesis